MKLSSQMSCCNFEGQGMSLELPLVQCSSRRVKGLDQVSFKEVSSLEEVRACAPLFPILMLPALLASLLIAVMPPRWSSAAARPHIGLSDSVRQPVSNKNLPSSCTFAGDIDVVSRLTHGIKRRTGRLVKSGW